MFWKEQIMSTLQSEKYLLQKLKMHRKHKYVYCVTCFFFFIISKKKKISFFSLMAFNYMVIFKKTIFSHGYQDVVTLNNSIPLYKLA